MRKILYFLFISPVIMAQTEVQSYDVIKKMSDAEIRFYPPVMMAKHTSKTQGSGFGKLYGYISGNNTNKMKIAMTSPVYIEKKSGENSMSFVLPKKFSNENTPQPKDPSLKVLEVKGGYFAAIMYSGYTSNSKEKEYTQILQKLLQKEKINPIGTPKILVYNSPYKFINRRNEILIPIIFETKVND